MLNNIIYNHVTNPRGVFRLEYGVEMCEDECISGSAADGLEAAKRIHKDYRGLSMSCNVISSLQILIGEVIRDRAEWGVDSVPWFRGEPRNVSTPLLPRLFRLKDGRRHQENKSSIGRENE